MSNVSELRSKGISRPTVTSAAEASNLPKIGIEHSLGFLPPLQHGRHFRNQRINPRFRILKTARCNHDAKRLMKKDAAPKKENPENKTVPEVDSSNEQTKDDSPKAKTEDALEDSLYLNGTGLRTFPLIGPNQRHIRLLSLQNNSIVRFGNLVPLNNLLVLDLYNNKIEKISGLQFCYNLRVLLLGKNRIRRTEGLDVLRSLEILDLHGNQLRYVDNLCSLTNLRVLNVAGNTICSIRNFGSKNGLKSLTELNLKKNRLKTLQGLENAPNIRKLLVSNNQLDDLSCIAALKSLGNLKELLIDPNPFYSKNPEAIHQLLMLLPSLRNLNRSIVTDEMKSNAEKYFEQCEILQLRNKDELVDMTDSAKIIDTFSEAEESKIIVEESSLHLMRTIGSLDSESKHSLDNERSFEEDYNFNTTSKTTGLKEEDEDDSSDFEVLSSNEMQNHNTAEFSLQNKQTKIAIVRPQPRNTSLDQINNEKRIFNEDQIIASKFLGFKELYDDPESNQPTLLSNTYRNQHLTRELSSLSSSRRPLTRSSSLATLNAYESFSSSKLNGASLKNPKTNSDRLKTARKKKMVRSFSVDTRSSSQGQVSSDTESISTSDLSIPQTLRNKKQRWQTAYSSSSATPRFSTFKKRPMTGIKETDGNIERSPSTLKRQSSVSINSTGMEAFKRQGVDYSVEIDGKTLVLIGTNSLKHFTAGFPEILTEKVTIVHFQDIPFDLLSQNFRKLRQTYPGAEHFKFRSNDINILAQLNALADLQGITSLEIFPEGNEIVANSVWEEYAVYRLAHWGLKQVNNHFPNRLCSVDLDSFESLGYIASASLPSNVLLPLAAKLHSLQNFCSCPSQSTSSDNFSERKTGENEPYSNNQICSSWEHDKVLKDVIGKEALVFNPQKIPLKKSEYFAAQDFISEIVMDGQIILQKLELLESCLPHVLQNEIEKIMVDLVPLKDEYTREELRKIRSECFEQK